MTKQLRYPAEAFALAMVLLSGGMKQAAVVGIGLIFAAVLQNVLRENLGEKYTAPVSMAGAVIGTAAIYGMLVLTDMTPGIKETAALAAAALLLVVSDERAKTQDIDYNALLLQSACAYAVYVVFSLAREYFGHAEIFGFELPKIGLVSHAYAKPMLALFVAAVSAAVINRILKVKSDAKAGLGVALPVLLIEAPFVWNNVNEIFGTIIGTLFGMIIYLSLRKRLALADTEEHIAGLPVELAMLGIIYMVFSFL